MAQSNLERQKTLYWIKVVDLKIAASYIGIYRDSLGKWTTGVAVVRAVASSASIGAWAIWRQYAFVWGSIIAVSQVLDALRDVFPFARKHKLAGELARRLDRLFIDAQLEWENIRSDKYTDEQVGKRLHTLRMLHHKAEQECFREGLPVQTGLFQKAQQEASSFFQRTYGVHSMQEGGNDGKLEAETHA